MKTKSTIAVFFLALICGCGASLEFPKLLNPPSELESESATQNSSSAGSSSQNSQSGTINNANSSSSASQNDAESGAAADVVVNYLLINEIYYDAPDADTNGDVFIELLGEAGVDLAGVKIFLVNGDDGKVYQTIELPAGALPSEAGIFVIADAITGSDSQTHVSGAGHILNFDPQNGPDSIIVVSKEGLFLDSVCYGKPKVLLAENGFSLCEGDAAVDVSGGKSIARVDGGDSGNNAVDFIEKVVPSPGFI